MFGWVTNRTFTKSYKVLVKVRFNTSKMRLGIKYRKFYIRLASSAAERPMTL